MLNGAVWSKAFFEVQWSQVHKPMPAAQQTRCFASIGGGTPRECSTLRLRPFAATSISTSLPESVRNRYPCCGSMGKVLQSGSSSYTVRMATDPPAHARALRDPSAYLSPTRPTRGEALASHPHRRHITLARYLPKWDRLAAGLHSTPLVCG